MARRARLRSSKYRGNAAISRLLARLLSRVGAWAWRHLGSMSAGFKGWQAQRRARHDSPPPNFSFETLEPRVLLSADLGAGSMGFAPDNAALVSLEPARDASAHAPTVQMFAALGGDSARTGKLGERDFRPRPVTLAPAPNDTPRQSRPSALLGDLVAPQISARLHRDTGNSSADRLSANPAITIDAAGLIGATTFFAALDPVGATVPTIEVHPSLQPDGSFILGTEQLAGLAGGVLDDGAHRVRLVAFNALGLDSGAVDLDFVLDTTAPAASTFDLAAAFDSDTVGDQHTTAAAVTLQGLAVPGASVKLLGADHVVVADGDGKFQFTGIALALGANTFTVSLADAAGNTSQRGLTLTRLAPDAPPTLSAALAHDSGASASDGITHAPSIQGIAGPRARITHLMAVLDPANATLTGTDISSLLQADGSFTVGAANLAVLAGGALADGAHRVRLVVIDTDGAMSLPVEVSFVLDTVAPVAATFDLASAFDSSADGDRQTDAVAVTLQGLTAPGTSVKLLGPYAVVTADADGKFEFAGIALALGTNTFTVTLTDAAGNASQRALTLTRVAVNAIAPTLSAALARDTGASATDGITNDAAVRGLAGHATRLFAILDPADGTLQGTDVSSLLQPDGSFVLSAAQMALLAGGAIADGAHTVRLVAADASGNRSAPVNLNFTLKTAAPAIASFALSAADASDASATVTGSARAQLRGVAAPGATITLAGQGLSTVAGAGGAFVLPDVALAMGDNPLTLTATDLAGNVATLSRTLTRIAEAQHDPVLAWNAIALNAIKLDVSDPPLATRVLAIQSIAVYDTLAAIEGSPSYLVQRSATTPVSVGAAVAAAAHRVLHQLYPGQRAVFDAALTAGLASIPDSAAKAAGIALGTAIADAVLAIRAADGYLDYTADDGSTELGKWRPSGPMYMVAQQRQWGDVTPFALASGDQFRSGPPPALDSAEYAAAVERSRLVGSASGSTRTADQTQQAHFWTDGGGSVTPPGHWNQIAAQVAAAQGNSLSANARLMAQLNVALADAAIACWDVKYAHDAWRPVTAIQYASLDGNAGTTEDPGWEPLLITPPHPEYVSGHAAFSAAAAGILGASFGQNVSFSTTSSTLPGVTRSFASFAQAAQEAGESRIYGGIHFDFSNQAGQELGQKVAGAVLARFALAQDTKAPSVVLDSTRAATNANLTFSGQVLDNLSGVASLQYRIDGGALQALPFDDIGKFSLGTSFALDGSNDGAHTISFLARDAAGNLSAFYSRSFTLDTRAPTLALSSLADGDALDFWSRLTGSADPTGSALVSLRYSIDGAPSKALGFDPASGGFDQALVLRDLGVGNHTLTLHTQDAAGNLGAISRSVSVGALAPFSVSGVTPTLGGSDVGTTFRPQVYFSRAVDPATLTAQTFYATGPDGARLDATVVPALDGSFAWMLFNAPMPGGSTVTLHLDGAAIRAAQDGSLLDADNDGAGGGELTWSFTTVSTASVAGTRLVGRVVDPGADLQPMTFDDVRRGPDGVIHTPDDVFLLPIAHAKVFIVGRPDLTTFTDAHGNFSFDGVPAGSVKVGIDGRTAINPPSGVFFPEMVMDVQLHPGVTNTLMGSMGAPDAQHANADRTEVYVPRVRSASLLQVSADAPTTIRVDEMSAPGLTDEQRSSLTLKLPPGSAVGHDGRPLASVQIGINTVPPALVKDMLPPGVLQHTFDITIQAPGVDIFTQPLKITFPNVFEAAPGTQLNILSFDHTTGRLVINGTGTVSADGKSVVSDEGSGILAPGWHGCAPPGAECCPPIPSGTKHPINAEPKAESSGLIDRLYTNDGEVFSFTIANARPPLDPTRDPCDPLNMQATPMTVEVIVDGPAEEFLNGLTFADGRDKFDLLPGQDKTYTVDLKDLIGKIKDYPKDVLYGVTVTVKAYKSGFPDDLKIDQKFYIYRFLDALDASLNDPHNTFHKDGVVMLADTLNDGSGKVKRERPFEVKTGAEKPTLEVKDTTNFPEIGTTTKFVFDPTQTSANKNALVTEVAIKTPAGAEAGKLKLSAEATPLTTIDVSRNALRTAIAAMVADGALPGGDVAPNLFTKSEAALFGSQAQIDSFADAVIAGMKAKFDAASALAGGYVFGTAADSIKFSWETANHTFYGHSEPTPADDGVDLDGGAIFNALKNASFAQYSLAQQAFIVSDLINQSSRTGVAVYIDNIFELQGMGENPNAADSMSMSSAAAINAITKTAIHEALHTLGMAHAASSGQTGAATAEVQILQRTGGAAGDTFTLNFQGYQTPALAFDAGAAAIEAALTALLSIGSGNLAVMPAAIASQLSLTFDQDLFGYDPPMITVLPTGGLTASVTSAVQGKASMGVVAAVPGGTADLMYAGLVDYTGSLSIRPGLSGNALTVGMHLDWAEAQIQNLITLWGNQLAAVPGAGQFPAFDSLAGPDSDIFTPLYDGPALAVRVSGGGVITRAIDFGDVLLDSPTDSVTRTFTLHNIGTQALVIFGIDVLEGQGRFSAAALPDGTQIAPGASLDYTVTYRPTAIGDHDATLRIRSNDPESPAIHVPVEGHGASQAPRLSVVIPNNNVGGQDLGAGPATLPNFMHLRNDGSQDLLISGITLEGDTGAFQLTGVPAGLSASTPFTIKSGESLQLGVTFNAGRAGLTSATLRIASNDAGAADTSVTIVGTGTDALLSPASSGGNYVALELIGEPATARLRMMSSDSGAWSFFLPPGKRVHYVMFDPRSGLVSHGYDTTARSGQRTAFTGGEYRASVAPDSDGDGLPDDVEFAIGTEPNEKDTNQDGIGDFASIEQGINPLGRLAVPIGVLSAITVQGGAEALAVTTAPGDQTTLTAFVATGNLGLAIIDVSKFQKPVLLAELDLPGRSVDVASDPVRQVVALAASSAGLHLVDVGTPGAPVLRQTVQFGSAVSQVEIRDGTAYVATGANVAMVDLNTGEVRATLDLVSRGGGVLTGLAFEGDILYTMDTSSTLRSVSVADGVLTARDAITLASGGGKLFVGGGVAYIGRQGLSTVDVTDPANLVLLSAPDAASIASEVFAANGSGLGISVGNLPGLGNVVHVVDVSDPTRTDRLITEYILPAAPRDLALANGLAFVADSSGLQVVNYRGFDTRGAAPAVSIAVDALDIDPAAPGIQVREGRIVHIRPAIRDDVQVRGIELLVNGTVEQADTTFPWELAVQAPAVARGGNTLTLQVRATDTGGNATLSVPVVLQVVADTLAPQLVASSIAEGERRLFVRAIDLAFDEPLDTARLDPAGASLMRAGNDGMFGSADDAAIPLRFDTRNFGQTLSVISAGHLLPGDYRLSIDPAIIADAAGNKLTAPIERTFSVPASNAIQAARGSAGIATAASANPRQRIELPVPFDPAQAGLLLRVLDDWNIERTAMVAATLWDKANGTASFEVPHNAVTGDAVVYARDRGVPDDAADGTFLLQIVPVVSSVEVLSVSADGSSAVLLLRGDGLVDGADSEYRFGNGENAVIVRDTGSDTGPLVVRHLDHATDETISTVQLTVPLAQGAFGPISIKTVGGASAGFGATLAAVRSVAWSGTPADPAQASANPGQAITLEGSGLSTASDILLRYTGHDGKLAVRHLHPVTASVDGTRATLLVPPAANGAWSLQMLGSASQPVLQIVPTLTGFSGNTLAGSGLVEGASRYHFPGATVVDDDAGAAIDVNVPAVPDEDRLPRGDSSRDRARFDSAALRHHGTGEFSVNTAGGTSAPLALKALRPGSASAATGPLADVAVDPASGALWTLDQADQPSLLRIDPATGLVLQQIALTAGSRDENTQGYAGLQILEHALDLADTSVPAGSLLLFHGDSSTLHDHVSAVDPSSGALLARLTLPERYTSAAGIVDPASGRLFLLSSRFNQMVEIDAQTGAEIARVSLSLDVSGNAGMAVDPTDGNFWIGTSVNGAELVQASRDGVQLRRVYIGQQGLDRATISGLAFATDGSLRVATAQGLIHHVNIDPDHAFATTAPTLSRIDSAALQGTPARADLAAANAGQVIELVGTNFGAGTQVLFNLRDADGKTSVAAVAPLLINREGTRVQVLVPAQADTGDVRVSNTGATDLGFGSAPDAAHRQLTFSFIAGGATASLNFADHGAGSSGSRSWGLDNVLVRQAGGVLFADDFEGPTSAEWSDATVNRDAGALSAFSGRFNDSIQILNLSGLVSGQSYTVSFDLYALDGWNAGAGNGDWFSVEANGATMFSRTISNELTGAQDVNASPGIRLQIVPTLTAVDNDRDLPAGSLLLEGSGFMEGAATVTVGGMVIADPDNGNWRFDVRGERNAFIQAATGSGLDGPIRVTTEGGFAELAGRYLDAQPRAVFTAIGASADAGQPANPARPSATAGQVIVLSGQGFTHRTLVQFQGIDDSGRAGTLTVRSSPYANGAALTVRVPTMARTGAVHVLGSDASFDLQVVPTLRAADGIVGTGDILLLEGTGFSAADLAIQIDGRAVDSFEVETVHSGHWRGDSQDQQLLRVSVPAGVGDGLITVSTGGGSSTLRTGAAATTALPGVAAPDPGEQIGAAFDPGLNVGQRIKVTGSIGHVNDVDLYRIELAAGEQVAYRLEDSSEFLLSLFNSEGVEQHPDYYSFSGQGLPFRASTAGVYYVGVSAYPNMWYDPIGDYSLHLTRQAAASSRISSIGASAASGTPHLATLASANTLQWITLNGSGLLNHEEVMFTILAGGAMGEFAVTSFEVAADGSSLRVRVPEGAITGTVRLAGDPVGRLLQIVPTLSDIDISHASVDSNSTLRLAGSGFIDGASAVLFDARRVDDASVGFNYESADDGFAVRDLGTIIDITVPHGATGPIMVRTAGGTSAALALDLSGNGARAAAVGATALAQVPIPVITGVEVQSVAADGASAIVVLRGAGLGDGASSAYRFGSRTDMQRVNDASASDDHVTLRVPFTDDAFGPISIRTAAGVSTSFSTGLAAIDAVAANGTPADPTAASANAGQSITLTGAGLSTASPVLLRYVDNKGSPATLLLHPSSALADGSAATLEVPLEANGAFALRMLGSSALLLLQIVPTLERFDQDGKLFGSGLVAGATRYDFPGNTVSDPQPSGAIEVGYFYDAARGGYRWNGLANIAATALARHGIGALSVTTTGGTSAPLALITLRPGSDGAAGAQGAPAGALGDVAIDPANGAMWAVNQENPGALLRIDPGSGEVAQTIALRAAFGNQYTASYVGLQVAAAPLDLGATRVPAGSLLLFEGYPYNGDNNVAAIDPGTGALIESLALPASYYSTAGVHDPASGHLFLLSHQLDQMVEIDPVSGALLARFGLPLSVRDHAGMAIDPLDGNLWIGSRAGGADIVKVSRTGQELRRIDLAPQGVGENEISGLAFDAEGSLYVASVRGAIHKVSVA